ncbi:MAG: Fic family protein [Bacteroidales bacterium]|nr:Fic family protein [Bacteroidales bacterium]MDT8374607.1 Fic family protein [Bacteroidales bacterium]
MKPPYRINPEILVLIVSVSEKIGEVNAAFLHRPAPELRRKSKIKTIHSSLEIEGNSLSLDQVTSILDNKRIIAPKREILEVLNAVRVYDDLSQFNPMSITSFCRAHAILMDGLVEQPGKMRTKSVGILKGSAFTHVAPPGNIVRSLMKELFDYLRKDEDLLLIKSCVFHYEMEFIHPFMDGNGRMGRLWQTLILRQYSPVFEFLPIETLIKERQSDYYRILGESDNKGESTGFIEFMLQIIDDSLEQLLATQNLPRTKSDRIEIFREKTGSEYFSRKDYLRTFKDISGATASRDLKHAVTEGILEKTGDKRMTRYRYI